MLTILAQAVDPNKALNLLNVFYITMGYGKVSNYGNLSTRCLSILLI